MIYPTTPSAREVYLRSQWRHQPDHQTDRHVSNAGGALGSSGTTHQLARSFRKSAPRCINSAVTCAPSDRAGLSEGHRPGWPPQGLERTDKPCQQASGEHSYICFAQVWDSHKSAHRISSGSRRKPPNLWRIACADNTDALYCCLRRLC